MDKAETLGKKAIMEDMLRRAIQGIEDGYERSRRQVFNENFILDEKRINTIVRMRPMSESELASKEDPKWKISGKTVESTYDTAAVFHFDHVFNETQSNRDIFNFIRPAVKCVMNGINATVLAYGRTGSGKTYTTLGNTIEDGIVQMAIDEMFAYEELYKQDRKFFFSGCFSEVYNERLNDLLGKQTDVFTQAHWENLDNPTELTLLVGADNRIKMRHLVLSAMAYRRISHTMRNRTSSRSHSIVKFCVESENPQTGETTLAHLVFVDLAGTEQLTTEDSVKRNLEGFYINQSLSCLQTVFDELIQRKEEVSYKLCLLTRILKGVIGGNSQTILIGTISPVAEDDAIHTLQFLRGALTVRSKPLVNVYNKMGVQMIPDTNSDSDDEIILGSSRRQEARKFKELIMYLKERTEILEEENKTQRDKIQEFQEYSDNLFEKVDETIAECESLTLENKNLRLREKELQYELETGLNTSNIDDSEKIKNLLRDLHQANEEKDFLKNTLYKIHEKRSICRTLSVDGGIDYLKYECSASNESEFHDQAPLFIKTFNGTVESSAESLSEAENVEEYEAMVEEIVNPKQRKIEIKTIEEMEKITAEKLALPKLNKSTKVRKENSTRTKKDVVIIKKPIPAEAQKDIQTLLVDFIQEKQTKDPNASTNLEEIIEKAFKKPPRVSNIDLILPSKPTLRESMAIQKSLQTTGEHTSMEGPEENVESQRQILEKIKNENKPKKRRVNKKKPSRQPKSHTYMTTDKEDFKLLERLSTHPTKALIKYPIKPMFVPKYNLETPKRMQSKLSSSNPTSSTPQPHIPTKSSDVPYLSKELEEKYALLKSEYNTLFLDVQSKNQELYEVKTRLIEYAREHDEIEHRSEDVITLKETMIKLSEENERLEVEMSNFSGIKSKLMEQETELNVYRKMYKSGPPVIKLLKIIKNLEEDITKCKAMDASIIIQNYNSLQETLSNYEITNKTISMALKNVTTINKELSENVKNNAETNSQCYNTSLTSVEQMSHFFIGESETNSTRLKLVVEEVEKSYKQTMKNLQDSHDKKVAEMQSKITILNLKDESQEELVRLKKLVRDKENENISLQIKHSELTLQLQSANGKILKMNKLIEQFQRKLSNNSTQDSQSQIEYIEKHVGTQLSYIPEYRQSVKTQTKHLILKNTVSQTIENTESRKTQTDADKIFCAKSVVNIIEGCPEIYREDVEKILLDEQLSINAVIMKLILYITSSKDYNTKASINVSTKLPEEYKKRTFDIITAAGKNKNQAVINIVNYFNSQIKEANTEINKRDRELKYLQKSLHKSEEHLQSIKYEIVEQLSEVTPERVYLIMKVQDTIHDILAVFIKHTKDKIDDQNYQYTNVTTFIQKLETVAQCFTDQFSVPKLEASNYNLSATISGLINEMKDIKVEKSSSELKRKCSSAKSLIPVRVKAKPSPSMPKSNVANTRSLLPPSKAPIKRSQFHKQLNKSDSSISLTLPERKISYGSKRQAPRRIPCSKQREQGCEDYVVTSMSTPQRQSSEEKLVRLNAALSQSKFLSQLLTYEKQEPFLDSIRLLQGLLKAVIAFFKEENEISNERSIEHGENNKDCSSYFSIDEKKSTKTTQKDTVELKNKSIISEDHTPLSSDGHTHINNELTETEEIKSSSNISTDEDFSWTTAVAKVTKTSPECHPILKDCITDCGTVSKKRIPKQIAAQQRKEKTDSSISSSESKKVISKRRKRGQKKIYKEEEENDVSLPVKSNRLLDTVKEIMHGHSRSFDDDEMGAIGYSVYNDEQSCVDVMMENQMMQKQKLLPRKQSNRPGKPVSVEDLKRALQTVFANLNIPHHKTRQQLKRESPNIDIKPFEKKEVEEVSKVLSTSEVQETISNQVGNRRIKKIDSVNSHASSDNQLAEPVTCTTSEENKISVSSRATSRLHSYGIGSKPQVIIERKFDNSVTSEETHFGPNNERYYVKHQIVTTVGEDKAVIHKRFTTVKDHTELGVRNSEEQLMLPFPAETIEEMKDVEDLHLASGAHDLIWTDVHSKLSTISKEWETASTNSGASTKHSTHLQGTSKSSRLGNPSTRKRRTRISAPEHPETVERLYEEGNTRRHTTLHQEVHGRSTGAIPKNSRIIPPSWSQSSSSERSGESDIPEQPARQKLKRKPRRKDPFL